MATAHEHVTEDVLTQLSGLLRGSASPAGTEVLLPLMNLLGGCPRCTAAAQRLLPPPVEDAAETGSTFATIAPITASLGHKVERWRELSSRQRTDASHAFAALMAAPEDDRRELVRHHPRFQSLALCRLLCEASRLATFGPRGPADQARQLASLAVELAAHLDARQYNSALVYDERAVAWAFLGNAHRVAEDNYSAEQAFAIARRLMRRGTGIDLSVVDVFDLEANFLLEQGEFDRALLLHERVLMVYQLTGEPLLIARALIGKGMAWYQAGTPAAAIQPLSRALEKIDSERDAHLYSRAVHFLTLCLAESGCHDQARAQLPLARRLCAELENQLGLLRLRWLEGKLTEGEDVTAAEQAFQEVRRGYLQRGQGYDAALVSLDLAKLYARSGRTSEVRFLASTLPPILETQDLGPEAAAALTVFRQAAGLGTATPTLVGNIAKYLRQLRYRPPVQLPQPS